MKWKTKGVFVLAILATSFQSCSKSSCKGGMCPVFSEVEVECQKEDIQEIKIVRVTRA